VPPIARAFINPRAGGLRARDPAAFGAALGDAVAAAGYQLDCCVIDTAVEPAFARLLSAPAPELLVVAAGDGTVRTAVRRMMGGQTALALLPAGTFNLLARDLGVPPSLDDALETLARSEPAAIDVADVNDELFLSAVALGLGADACALREQIREVAPLEWPETLFDAARRFADARPLHLRVTGDATTLSFASQAVFVANGPFRRNGLALMRRDSLASGRLALYAQRHASRWAGLMTLARARLGGFRRTEIIDETLTGLRLETRPREVLATIDGEMRTLHSPLVFTLRPRALNVRRPLPTATPAA